jgi:large subunit ribosomal protein L15
MKLKKTKKAKKMRGKGMGTHGWGARKKHMGSGHRGGFGMAGTGKRADQKKSLVIKKYGRYFGKQGFTSRGSKNKINKVINLDYIEKNLESLKKKYEKDGIIEIKDHKILGRGEIKSKVEIKAAGCSAEAKKKIEAVGGKVIVPEIKVKEVKKDKAEEEKEEEAGKEKVEKKEKEE